MTLTKVVDGVEIKLSKDEETSLRAEWAENEALKFHPNNVPLNPAQFHAALHLMGLTVEQVEGAIDIAMADPAENAFAKAKVGKSLLYRRDDALFAALAPLLSITDQQIDDAWMQAKDFR